MLNLKPNKRSFIKFLFLSIFSTFFFTSKKLKSINLKAFEDTTGFKNYGKPSKFEKIFRWISANPKLKGNGASYSPLSRLRGLIFPNGLHFERHHYGVKQIDPVKYKLSLLGIPKNEITFSLHDLRSMKLLSLKTFIECGGNSNAMYNSNPLNTNVDLIHGLISFSEWTGVPLINIFKKLKFKSNIYPKWIEFESSDNGRYNISIPFKKAMSSGILALYQNGEPLRPEQGYPVRLIIPGWEGSTHVKWLRFIKFRDTPVHSRNETSRYTDLLENGKSRQFSFFMRTKSIIVDPHLGKKINPGENIISGIAWSGDALIKKVEISYDSGKKWINCPFENKDKSNMVRFQQKFEWSGEELIIQSRCKDSRNYTQPSRNKFLKKMGKNAYYHYNGMTSWKINRDGYISHVYID